MKNNEHKKLDQVLKDQLSEGTASVPDFVWDRIEEELFPKKKRRGFFWWFFGGICMLLMATFLGIAFSDQKAHSQSTFLSPNPVSKASNGSILKAESPASKNEYITPNPLKTKGHPNLKSSSAHEHTNEINRSSNSKFTRTNQKSEQKSNEKAFGSHSKAGSATPVSSGNLSLALKDPAKDPKSSNLPIIDSNSIVQSNHGKRHNELNEESKTALDSVNNKDLSYPEILALVKRDLTKNPKDPKENKRNSFFSLGIYGGLSLYNTAVFKDYFTSGLLSKRSFASSGFELGLQARFKIGNRFRVYTGFAFNQKQTQFNYNLAITQADYFTYVANGEKVPLENIRDDGANSCFLAKDVAVHYQMQSLLISLGTSFEFLKIGKFTAAADLRLSCNVYSSLKLKETRVLDIQQPNSEKFSYFQPGAGISLNYQLNRRISLGLAPLFSKQFYVKESFSRKMNELVIPVSVSFQL